MAAVRPDADRLASRERNPKWKLAPLRIDMSECINCDTCLRHCPPQFGAIFNHGIDVIIIPELCSGCDKCLDPCPVDCIYRRPRLDAGPGRLVGGARLTDDPTSRPASPDQVRTGVGCGHTMSGHVRPHHP